MNKTKKEKKNYNEQLWRVIFNVNGREGELIEKKNYPVEKKVLEQNKH